MFVKEYLFFYSAMKVKYETTELEEKIKPQRKLKRPKKKIKPDRDLNFEGIFFLTVLHRWKIICKT